MSSSAPWALSYFRESNISSKKYRRTIISLLGSALDLQALALYNTEAFAKTLKKYFAKMERGH